MVSPSTRRNRCSPSPGLGRSPPRHSHGLSARKLASPLLSLLFAFAAATSAAQTLDANLVVNGDAEADTGVDDVFTNVAISDWVDPGAVTVLLYGESNFPALSDPTE